MNAASSLPSPLLRIAYVLALLALAQPFLTIVSPQLNGWRPDHAHVQLAGDPPRAHAHPYDHASRDHNSSASTDVGFLAPDIDGSVAVLPSPATLLAPEALGSTPPLARALPADALIETDLPPPRA